MFVALCAVSPRLSFQQSPGWSGRSRSFRPRLLRLTVVCQLLDVVHQSGTAHYILSPPHHHGSAAPRTSVGRRNEVKKEPPQAAGDTSAAGLPMVAGRGPGALRAIRETAVMAVRRVVLRGIRHVRLVVERVAQPFGSFARPNAVVDRRGRPLPLGQSGDVRVGR